VADLPWKRGKLPNEQGKGGRPAGFQKKEETAAKDAIETVREESPQTFPIPPRKGWEKQYDAREKEIERREAESILQAREGRLQAIEQETAVLRVNRALALRFSAATLHLVEVTERVAKDLKRKVEAQDDLSMKDINSILKLTGSTIHRAQSAIGTMAKVERYIHRHPLDDGGVEEDDLAGLDADGAKQILTNLHRSLNAAVKKIEPIDTTIVDGETDEDSDP
jgi:hypothetical protein